ncbi:MAG: cytochrome c maturation protein CcmE [Geminicoccaceae bacterium]|nr:MAG: cytochrome c maturation protein CcmE [Geminicoccaceae bacterium]
MRTRKRQRFLLVSLSLLLLGGATALILTALEENIAFFAGPAELVNGQVEPGKRLRLGGLVVDGSVLHGANGEVRFHLTDELADIEVRYVGILPDLFREGQGIVAIGMLSPEGRFDASEVLAKHDEGYMPPEVAEALERANHLMRLQEAGS